MAADAVKSLAITNLEATPNLANEIGAGANAHLKWVDGWCAATAVGIGTATSTYRLVRFPTWAKIKQVWIWTDVALDTNATQTLALDFNLAFSTDTTGDGTPASLTGLVPTTVGNPTTPTAATTTTFASYTTPNKLFGIKTLSGNNAAIALTEITNQGTNYTRDKFLQMPAWRTFGFQDGRGMLADPGGFFDLVAYASTGAATGAAGNLFARLAFTN